MYNTVARSDSIHATVISGNLSYASHNVSDLSKYAHA